MEIIEEENGFSSLYRATTLDGQIQKYGEGNGKLLHDFSPAVIAIHRY